MRVQIVEDNPALRDGLAELLRLEGYDCVTFADGIAALEAFRALPFDMVVLDVVLPGLDGLDLCRRFRKIAPHAQILMLSARSQPIDKRLGLEMGADDYLGKPFDPGELVARLTAMARRLAAHSGIAARFQMADIWVDPARHLALRDGQQIDLNPRELSVLTLLYDNTDRPVSRDTLFDRCWGRDYFPNSRALDQYMSALRRKIERDPQNPQIIETVRGVGYRYARRG